MPTLTARRLAGKVVSRGKLHGGPCFDEMLGFNGLDNLLNEQGTY